MIRELGNGVGELSDGLKKHWRYFRQLFTLFRNNMTYFHTLLSGVSKFRHYFTQLADKRKGLGRQMQQYFLVIKTIASIQAEFDQTGLMDITTITENYPFFLITCRKDRSTS